MQQLVQRNNCAVFGRVCAPQHLPPRPPRRRQRAEWKPTPEMPPEVLRWGGYGMEVKPTGVKK